ncbi:hypothetical protein C8R45DRAFT_918550 [Mycena sanguinolenta]|nr:hypothetical protein C8R45DRAFT_918550 [Mycena sanguinolenta]
MLLLLFLAFLAFGKAHATLSNITIDDSNSAYFTFVGSYHAVTPNAPCEGCLDQPDPAQVYNSTWHDGALRSGSFVFQGTAVYIFGIDVNNPANVSFAMNNPTVNSFHYYSGTTYGYHSLFFSATNLDASVQHTVTWLMEQSSIGGGSALFDYAIITLSTFQTPPPVQGPPVQTPPPVHAPPPPPLVQQLQLPPPVPLPTALVQSEVLVQLEVLVQQGLLVQPKSKTGPIIGALVGVVGGLVLIGIIIFYLRRRRSRGAAMQAIDSFDGLHNPHGSDMASRDTSGVIQYAARPFEPVRFPPPPPRSIAHSETSPTASFSLSSVSRAPIQSDSTSSKPVPADLAPELNDPIGQRARNLEVEERLRHLEELIAASQPPSYS